jgi:RimJ/RimL family protein N-acetyltransferase
MPEHYEDHSRGHWTGVSGMDTIWHGEVALSTPRLLLRAFRADDLPLYAALNADPEVTEFLGGAISATESDDIADWAQALHSAEGIGLLAVERREDAAFLGMCGLHHLYEWFPGDIEIGWRLSREHWGHGYATEAAQAWLTHAFTVLDLPRVISVTDQPNTRSIAVMRRLGMTVDHYATLEEDGQQFDAVIHAITREQWHERHHAEQS